MAQRIARYIVAALLALLVAALAWRLGKGDKGSRLCAAALYAVTAMFMLSPVQFPWYFLWLLPLLALRPSPALLLLTATLPLYYLKFHYAARGDAAFFHYRIVWVEFAPVWVLLTWEAVTRRGLFARAYPQAGRVPSDRRFSA